MGTGMKESLIIVQQSRQMVLVGKSRGLVAPLPGLAVTCLVWRAGGVLSVESFSVSKDLQAVLCSFTRVLGARLYFVRFWLYTQLGSSAVSVTGSTYVSAYHSAQHTWCVELVYRASCLKLVSSWR